MTLQPTTTPQPLQEYLGLLARLGIKFDPTLRPAKRPKSGAINAVTGAGTGTNVIPMGSRNSRLASDAGSMRNRGASEAEILDGLREINAERVDPPLDDTELAQIARSIGSYPVSSRATEQARSLNDTGNALRLVDKCCDRIRYVAEHKRWLIWNGSRWVVDDVRFVIELAKATAKSIYGEAATATTRELGDALAKHAHRSLDVARIKAMIELAASDPRIVVRAADLDRHDHLLGVANGVVDLRTGKLRPARPEDLITRHSPVAYDPKAKCPTWHRFLNRVTNSNRHLTPNRRHDPGRKLAAYLQRAVGYALSGSTDEQVLFFLYGAGANGKTTFLKIVEEVLGPELTRQLPYDSLVERKQPRSSSNDVARLHGARAAFTSEVEDGTSIAESLVKQLTGGEAISARFLYAEYFEFVPKFKLFIAGNHKPIIKGDDHGIWRRLQLVPFEVTIPEAQRDPRLLEKLRAELPGILAWAIRGHRRWLKERLAPPTLVTDAVKEYRDEMDLLGEWIKDCCDVGPGKVLPARDGYRSYEQWAQANGLRPMSSPIFGRRLKERFPRRKMANRNVYDGLEIPNGGCGGLGRI